jgi:hypothetical protein
MLSRAPVMVDGRSYTRDVPIRVTQTPTGIEIAFGQFGFLGGTPEPAVRAFKQARSAFVSRYGSKNVKTQTSGAANKSVQATAAVSFVSNVAGDSLLPGFAASQFPAAVPDLGRWTRAPGDS